MSLGKTVFTSAFLLFFRKIWGNVINLVVMAFLARMLSKEDFGLLAISSVFLSIINTLATSGIAEYVVYYDGEDKIERVNAAFWLNLLLTIGVIVVVIALGPLWSNFYHSPKIYSLVLLLCIPFFFEMGSTIPKALLRKELDYVPLVYYSSVSMTLVSVGKLGAAFAGFGVYSLVIPQAIVAPFLMLSFFIRTAWRPSMAIGLIHFPTIFRYTKNVIGGRVLSRIVNEGDNLIVGKIVGMEGLGIYALAFQLANLVTTNVVFIVNDLLLPVFSKVKGDILRVKEIYFRMLNLLVIGSFPLTVAMILSAEGIVGLIYGTKWEEVVIPFQILSLFALSRSINSPTSSLFNSLGKPEINFKFGLYFAPVFLLSVYVGGQYGVVGVAIATTVTRFFGAIVLTHLAMHLVKTTFGEFAGQLKYIGLPSLLTFLIFSFILMQFEATVSNEVRIALVPIVLYFNLILYRLLYVGHLKSLIYSMEAQLSNRRFMFVIRKLLFVNGTK